MKTNKEMAQSILDRASGIAARRKEMRTRAAGLLAGALCLALILGLSLAPWGPEQPPLPTEGHVAAPPTQETEPTQPQTTEPTQPTQPTEEQIPVYTGQMYFLSGTEETGTLVPAQADMTFATESLFRFRSYKGMTDAEKYQASIEELTFYGEFRDKHDGNGDGGRYGIYRSEEFFSMTLSGGLSSLVLPDASLIEGNELETNGVFHVDECIARYKKTVTFGEGENAVTIPDGSYRIHLHIRMSDETFKRIRENPDLKYSTLKDNITVTIYYKDGTKAVVKIDVTMNDEGYFFLSMRGNNEM